MSRDRSAIARHPAAPAMLEYDYVIVGAGSAGATLAGRLSADPTLAIALLEAGPDWRSAGAPAALRSANPSLIINAPQYAKLRWDALAARRTRVQSPRLYWRGRGLGGSSTINGQIAIRPMPDDYQRWAAAGCSGWAFADVLPYFRRLETDLRYGARDYHGDGGPIPIYRAPQSLWGPVDLALGEAGVELGYGWAGDHNAPGALGVSPYAINSRDGARVTTNDAYLEPARGRNNLTVLCDAQVDCVLFDGGRACGVRYRIEGEAKVLRAREVILAAGAVHSPAILLRSGVGPAAHLEAVGIPVRHSLPVGEHFQDHPIAALPIVLKPERVPPAGFRHTNCCIRYSSGHADCGAGDMMIVAMNRLGDGLGRNTRAPTLNFGLIGVWVNECFSRGKVQLASADPSVEPIVDENMLDDERDVERMRDGVRRLVEIARQPGFDAIADLITIGPGGESLDALAEDTAIDAWALNYAGDAQHATSSCRMGAADDAASVVDPHCRVIGLDGLRVIDASVLPSVPTANTHLATVMLAECMAERLTTRG